MATTINKLIHGQLKVIFAPLFFLSALVFFFFFYFHGREGRKELGIMVKIFASVSLLKLPGLSSFVHNSSNISPRISPILFLSLELQ